MALKEISVARYWEMTKIEEERTAAYDGMLMLRNVRGHLRDDFASWPESQPAIDQLLSPLIGQLEKQNKDLGEKAFALWEQIIEMDGAQLKSVEIERQQSDAASGMSWLLRTMKHLNTMPEEDGKGEILTALMDLCSELNLESHRLRESHRKHQRLQAERLALQSLGAAS
jgi:hypothetical protein